MPVILEGIVTTLDAQGKLNVAPMGPIVEPSMSELILRPFKTSSTYRNLKVRPQGVFHVTDNVLLLARAAVHRWESRPETFPAQKVEGRVIKDACRWYEFQIETFDESQERTRLTARVVHSGRRRDFFGLSRAKHAVVEAAILATRVDLLPRDDLMRQFQMLRPLVEKTGSGAEREAFALLEEYVGSQKPPA